MDVGRETVQKFVRYLVQIHLQVVDTTKALTVEKNIILA